jgi:hypothetical protein
MRLFFLVLLAGLLASCGSSSPRISPQQTADPAADLVHNFGVGSNLERMATSVARGAHTNGMLSPGQSTEEIRKLLPKYQPQWDANLAKAYANHLSAEELRSLAKTGRSSPYFGKLTQVQPLVSADMQQMSKGILQGLVTEALTNASHSGP